MSESDWNQELATLRSRGVELAPPLTDAEIDVAENRIGASFPPDLRSLLSSALPVSQEFPDWRQPMHPGIEAKLAWPLEGIKFDVEHNDFWWPEWGPRPSTLPEAFAVATSQVASAPRLIPIYGHRYLPAEPESAGNPVFSVYQTDIIYYGTDLRAYIACEFGGLGYGQAVSGSSRRIRFWSDIVDWGDR